MNSYGIDFEDDLIEYFVFMEKIQSGHQGYPTNSRFEPTSHTAKKCDPTANEGFERVRFIYDVMCVTPKPLRDVLEQKYHAVAKSDHERAEKLSMSVQKYYQTCRVATAFIAGNYANHQSDRRKKHAVPSPHMV